jgi:hypothetical protein
VTGHTPEADGLVTGMKRRIGAIVASAKTKASGATVYHELDPTLYSLTSSTFVGRVYALFGLKNLTTGQLPVAEKGRRAAPSAMPGLRSLVLERPVEPQRPEPPRFAAPLRPVLARHF